MKTMNVTIDHLTKEGVGVTRIEKKPMYIMYAIDNEEVKVNVEYVGKRNIFGSVNEVIKPSVFRCNPKCSVYYQCGGCHLSHMSYEGQLDFKTRLVSKLYKEAGFEDVIVHPCVGQDTPYFYRNKVQTPVQRKGKNILAGFYKEDTHDIIPYDRCFVQDNLSNKIIKAVVAAMKENRIEPYNEDSRTGVIRHVLVRRARKETMLVLITNVNSFPGRNNFVQAIKKKVPEITTIVQNINPRHTNVILGEKENILYGKGFIIDDLCGINFKISPKSFYQINKEQCEKLYTKAIDLASLTGNEVVLDAYCGIGTIGMIASKKAKEVYGVEIVADAIKDAKMNAKNNNITNCKFYCADAQDFMRRYDGEKMDTVFVDPPRKGCSEQFLNSLVKFKPNKIVYISCNPETQVRDVKYLLEKGYTFKEVYPYDMFPQTFHVETVTLLQRKDIDDRLKVRFDLDNVPLVKEETKATYQEIKDYIFNKYNVKVSTLNIAQIKTKYGIIERECYNKPKDEDSRQPKCTREKENMIVDALKHFKML